MTFCVKCRKSECNEMICFPCYKKAIKELTTILKKVESDLRASTVKVELLQAAVRARSRAAAKPTKEIKLIVSDNKSTSFNRASGF